MRSRSTVGKSITFKHFARCAWTDVDEAELHEHTMGDQCSAVFISRCC